MSGCQLGHVLGREQVIFVRPQTGEAYVLPQAGPPTETDGGALHVISSDINRARKQQPRRDARLGPYDFETFPDRFEGSWAIQAHVIPPAALTSRPDAHHLLVGAFGTHTFNSGTSIAYTLSNSGLCRPLSILRLANRSAAIFSEALRLCPVNLFRTSFNGTEPPQFAFEGPMAEWVGTGPAEVDETGTTQTEIDITAATIDNLMRGSTYGSRIQVGVNTNGGSGYEVTNVDRVNDDVTVSPGVTVTDGDAIIPYAPTPTLSSAPLIGHTVGGMTIDAVDVPVVQGEIILNRNLTTPQLFGTDTFDDATPGFADITGSFTIEARADWTLEMIRATYREERSISVVYGTGAGRTVTHAGAQFIADEDKIDLGGERGQFVIPGRFLASAEGALDALSLTFT